jgi:hypothetical protein
MILPLAHTGHWAVSLLYLAPVVILVGALFITRARDARLGDEDADDDGVFADGAWDDDLDGRPRP